MINTLAVFCGSHLGRNPRFLTAAQQLGSAVAAQRRTLVYGGSNLGYMGAVSSAALDGGARVVSVIPTIFSDDVINSQPRAETVLVASMQERKSHMIALCDAFVALPGGIGTLDEVTEILMSNQLALCYKPVGILNIDGYFDPFIQQLYNMIDENLLSPDVRKTLFVDADPLRLLAKLDAFCPDSQPRIFPRRR
ncbi:MAG: TIGR00730 family Rossman fold protein [Bacteroidales bacterium]|nr:TIGR00730 family Rossman fold protein [Bacteroidales bacterium]